MKKIANYFNVYKKKFAPGTAGQKLLCRRGLSLLLAALLLVSVINPLFGLFVRETKAAEDNTVYYYNGNPLDGSVGTPQTGWLDLNAGTEEAPYIIKTADDLMGLSNLVNGGTDFSGKFIRLEGLTEEETTNNNTVAGVIDLRIYNGGSGDVGKNVSWEPIGKTENRAFKGTLYSNNNVSVINLNFASSDKDLTCFGLVGYNEGTVRDFSISYTAYGTGNATSSTPTGLNFTSITNSSLKDIGSAVACNKNSGTVSGITVGVGGQVYDTASGTFQFEKDAVLEDAVNRGNKPIITLGRTSIRTFGGVVGASYGTVENCSFYGGTIQSTVNLSVAESKFAFGAVGGIAGYAGDETSEAKQSSITNCVANVNMQINTIGQYNGYGGIVGKSLKCDITNCVAYGSISAKDAGNDTDNQFGGIGGCVGASSNVSQCISAVDIEVMRYSTIPYKNSDYIVSGAVGGIAGTLINSQLRESFSMGNLSSMTAVGGLVGNLADKNNNTVVDNCYSACAVTIGISNGDSGIGKSTGYWDTGVHAAGGLVGFVGSTNAVLSNSYFSGSTLKSEIGSIFGSVAGDAAISKFLNVYFDKQVSPNRAAGAYRGAGKDQEGYAKNTADIQKLGTIGYDNAIFAETNGGYLALKWVENLTGNSEFNQLAKAFSKISTNAYLNLDATFGSAYTAKDVGTNSNALTKPTSSSSGVTYGDWTVKKEYTGVQKVETLGGIYNLTATVNSPVGVAYSVNVSRKLLLPMNVIASSPENANSIPDEASFKRFLDITTVASGAYIGGVFTLSQNITDVITVESVTKKYSDNGLMMMDNLFCATLDGAGKSIGGITVNGVTAGILGSAMSGTVQNMTVNKIVMGTTDMPYKLPNDVRYQRVGLFCSRIKSTAFQDINIGDISITLDGSNSNNQCSGFGVLAAYNPNGSDINKTQSRIENISVQNAEVSVANMGNKLYIGLLAGELHRVTVENNTIQTLKFKTSGNQFQFRSLGGFVGAIPDANSTIQQCRIDNLDANIAGHEGTYENFSGFGGIIGYVAGNISNCIVSGKISGSLRTAARARAGGITTFGNSNRTITNCTFIGSIEGFKFSGGLVSYSDNGFKLYNSNVIGDIHARRDIIDTYSGGLIGDMSNGANQINDSYFMGNVSGGYAGGLAGYSRTDVTITNSYAKAIIKGTAATGYVGGFVGQAGGPLTVNSSYFAGQLQGEGSQGAFAASAPSLTPTNAYFDRSIAGANVATVPSITIADKNEGAALDAACAKKTEEITPAALGGNFANGENDSNYYPSHKAETAVGSSLIDEATKTLLKNLSTKKVFLVKQETTGNEVHSLLTKPYFQLEQTDVNGVTITVTPVTPEWEGIVQSTDNANYTPKEPGGTTATVTYSGIDAAVLPELNMIYDIMYVPFDHGKGTQNDPYIIYDAKELKKFKEYVDGGFDTANTWYKIASETDFITPITINLQETGVFEKEWQSIQNFQGHLDGNNSVLENLTQSTPTKDSSNAEYVGLFATSSGEINDLTLNHVALTPDFTSTAAYVGSLVAYATGGNYISCHVLNNTPASDTDETLREPNTISGGNAAAVGGLIGSFTVSANSAGVVQGCTVLADISFGNVTSGVGGVIGYADLHNSAVSFNVTGTASYGSASVNKTSLGGIVGGTRTIRCPISISNCVSTMDLTVIASSSLLGGIFAGNTAVTNDTTPSSVKFNTCYFGGKLTYPQNIKALGGIAAVTFLYQDLTGIKTGSIPRAKLSMSNLFYKDALYDGPEELGSKVDKLYEASEIFTNCAYNYNVNHVPAATTIMRCYINVLEEKGTVTEAYYSFINASYTSFLEVMTARSTTQEMTKGKVSADGDQYIYLKGYYPIPTRLVNGADDPPDVGTTEQNEAYMNYMARFYSAAIYYTNADEFGDNTYSNIYLLSQSDPEGNIGETLDTTKMSGPIDKVTVTYNGKMVQSTDNADTTVTVPLIGAYLNTYRFEKSITFQPSVVACGVSDSSYVYANPEGMWLQPDSTANVKYPWVIYTTDQLQGLTAVVNNIPDGNGIVPGDIEAVDYNNVTIPADEATSGAGDSQVNYQQGETFAIGHDLDGSSYKVFAPVCPDNLVKNEAGVDLSKPFDSQLNGLGHVITNLNITRAVGEGERAPTYTKLGLFGQVSGAELKNFGLVNLYTAGKTNGVLYDLETSAVGSIAASLENSSVQNCFSALPVIGQGKAGQSIGGLVGEAKGTNHISGSFFTGVLYTEAAEGQSAPDLGGLLGNVGGTTTVADSYLAGFLQSNGETAAITPAGNVAVNNYYYDLNATGDLSIINNGAEAADFGSGNYTLPGFSITAGFYPVQNVFSNANREVKAATLKIKLTNARSATNGSIISNSDNFTLGRVDSYNGVASTGTITLSDNKFSFTKQQSGFVFLSAGRLAAADLKCWYDNKIDNEYTINTAKELLEFSKIVNGDLESDNNPNGNHTHAPIPDDFKGCTVRLGSDIDLADLGKDFPWESIGTSGKTFKGTFDGNGHIITINNATQSLFGTIDEGATIRNLGLNGSMDAQNSTELVAPLAQLVTGGSSVTGCFSAVEITNAVSASGLIGELSDGSSLTNSFNMGSIQGNGTLAGLVLTNKGSIENCYNVGVIISIAGSATVSGSAAGIALNNNSGSVSKCFNASYVSAKETYAVADGSVTDCACDSKLMESPLDSVVKGIGSNFGGPPDWVSGSGSLYPQLAIFAGDDAFDKFKTVSALSALILNLTGTNYQEFTSASIFSEANGQVVDLNPAEYEMSLQNKEYTLTNSSAATGTQTVVASAAGFSHSYHTSAKATMKIRYKFDFSGLLGENPTINTDYHLNNIDALPTWDENESSNTFLISTAADFKSFISYVNAGKETKGKIFRLNYNIDFGNDTLEFIKTPFNGTFDGGYYTLSNFNIAGQGSAAIFSEIGETGRVENLALSNVKVTVGLQPGAPETNGAVIAVNNKGFIGNVALNDCVLTVNNNNATSSSSYVGMLAAKNNGRITGCYARNMSPTGYALFTNSHQPDYSGSLVGHNRGTLSGCYFVGRISQIYLIAGMNEGQIHNCYYAMETMTGSNPGEPSLAKGAYRSSDVEAGKVAIDKYWLTHEQMQTQEFAAWLSSNIYGGAYEVGTDKEFVGGSGGTKLNGGFPYLTGFELVKYDLASYFPDKSTMLLSVWNTSENGTSENDTAEGSISNGIFALDNLQFKYFSDIIVNTRLDFNMHELPNGIDYLVSNARVYGKDAQYKDYKTDGANNETILKDFPNTNMWNTPLTATSTAWHEVVTPNLVVVTIQFKGKARETPWGNYRTWSSTTGIEQETP